MLSEGVAVGFFGFCAFFDSFLDFVAFFDGFAQVTGQLEGDGAGQGTELVDDTEDLFHDFDDDAFDDGVADLIEREFGVGVGEAGSGAGLGIDFAVGEVREDAAAGFGGKGGCAFEVGEQGVVGAQVGED